MKTKNKTVANTEPEKIISLETFRKLGDYEMRNLTSNEPTCFNGIVSIVKYKITVEEIEEPKEVYEERLQKLWDECDNYHHWDSLRATAKRHGIVLQGNCGNKVKRRY
jgi:hypothetical protein